MRTSARVDRRGVEVTLGKRQVTAQSLVGAPCGAKWTVRGADGDIPLVNFSQ